MIPQKCRNIPNNWLKHQEQQNQELVWFCSSSTPKIGIFWDLFILMGTLKARAKFSAQHQALFKFTVFPFWGFIFFFSEGGKKSSCKIWDLPDSHSKSRQCQEYQENFAGCDGTLESPHKNSSRVGKLGNSHFNI